MTHALTKPQRGAHPRDMQCYAFIRRRYPYGTNIYCHVEPTHNVWTIGPHGEVIFQGHRCARHVHKLAEGFAHKDGWRVEVAEIDDAARSELKDRALSQEKST